MGQTSKTAETLFIPYIVTNNKPVPHPTGGDYNWKFHQYEVDLGLVNGQVCTKALPSILPMVVRALEFGGDSD